MERAEYKDFNDERLKTLPRKKLLNIWLMMSIVFPVGESTYQQKGFDTRPRTRKKSETMCDIRTSRQPMRRQNLRRRAM
eukprot:scaffold260545_cov31-Prasinocladus_malaysianus.AAC.2